VPATNCIKRCGETLSSEIEGWEIVAGALMANDPEERFVRFWSINLKEANGSLFIVALLLLPFRRNVVLPEKTERRNQNIVNDKVKTFIA
jgi:hypothetical protein